MEIIINILLIMLMKNIQHPRNNTQQTRHQLNTTNYDRHHNSNKNNQTNNQIITQTNNR